MARLPTVAIIGRPNTGKSTLFNRLVGRRQAIVSETAGTTRDHVAARIETEDVTYLLIDTGGMGGGTEDKEMEDDVHAQSTLAITGADVIIFTVNSREELTASDFEIANILRKRKRGHVPVILVPTKCDNPESLEEQLTKYYELGVTDEIIPISAVHTLGIDKLQSSITKHLNDLHFGNLESLPVPARPAGERQTGEVRSPMSDVPHIAIVGKPNVGKSSLVNALMSDPQRESSPRLVSDIAGTTRDATDMMIKHEEKEYVFVDTAGLKRHAKVEEGVESFAMLRTIQAMEHADIAILLLDATEPLSRQDKRIASLAIEQGKGLIILLNKIDLLTKEKKEEKMQEVAMTFVFCKYAPVIVGSAVTREGISRLFDIIDMVQRNRTRRIATKDLNDWYRDTVPGQPMGELLKCKYMTQGEELPPTFILFVKDPKKVQVSQLRFLENRMRGTFDFNGTPIRWITKAGEGQR